jgi:hypothetical protein
VPIQLCDKNSFYMNVCVRGVISEITYAKSDYNIPVNISYAEYEYIVAYRLEVNITAEFL